MKSSSLRHICIPAIVAIFAFLSGCNAIRGLVQTMDYPEVSYKSMNFESLSFDGVTMRFNFDVDNPNRLDLRAEGYAYTFSIDGNTFMQGSSSDQIELPSRAASLVSIPLEFSFRELSRTVSSVITQDSIEYEISSVFKFDLPVLGERERAVSASGYLPVPRLPKLSLENVSLAGLSFTGAEVLVRMRFENPNNFGLAFSDIGYNLEVDGNRWISTKLNDVVDLAAKGIQIIEVPVRLDFSQVGASVYKILTNREAFRYRVTGEGTVDVDLPYFEESTRLPFDINGEYSF